MAVLHDVLEDSDITFDELKVRGYPSSVVVPLRHLTRNVDESYRDYILRAKYQYIANRVKREDLKHNLSDLKAGHQRDKYELALWILEN